MANLFKVGDTVKCQKNGGQTGLIPKTPEFSGKVVEVMAGGNQYKVQMKGGMSSYVHFKNGIVDETSMSAA